MSGATNAPYNAGPGGSFTIRAITVVISLGQGQFGESGTDTVTVANLRCSASIAKDGAQFQGTLDLHIYGMTDSLMQQLTQFYGLTPNAVQRGDTVTVLAGDAASGMSVAYSGAILNAWVDYTDAPGVSFHVMGMAAALEALKPVPPSSYRGGTDVVSIVANLASTMGLGFENNGVSGIILHNPYFPGVALDQFERCLKAARINGIVDKDRGVLAIWPLNGSRSSAVPLVSPTSGMIGYPVRNQIGVNFACLYNPAIIIGGLVQVQSANTPAVGTWKVIKLSHTLESETPGGQWFSAVECVTIL